MHAAVELLTLVHLAQRISNELSMQGIVRDDTDAPTKEDEVGTPPPAQPLRLTYQRQQAPFLHPALAIPDIRDLNVIRAHMVVSSLYYYDVTIVSQQSAPQPERLVCAIFVSSPNERSSRTLFLEEGTR